MTAYRQKRRLKNKTQSDRQKIKFSGSKNTSTQSDPCPHHCREETDCRNN